jgi:hypothetical protein
MFLVSILYEGRDRKTHHCEFHVSGPDALSSIDSIVAAFMVSHYGHATVYYNNDEAEFTFRFNGL